MDLLVDEDQVADYNWFTPIWLSRKKKKLESSPRGKYHRYNEKNGHAALAKKSMRAGSAKKQRRGGFGGDSQRPKRNVVVPRSYDDDADDSDFDIREGDLLGGASAHDAVAATIRMNRMLASRRIGEERGRRRARRTPAPRPEPPIVLDSESEEAQSESSRYPGARPHENRPLSSLGPFGARPLGAREPRETIVIDDSTESPPVSREVRALRPLWSDARDRGFPSVPARRARVPTDAYSPPVHVPRRRPRPEDAPLREGHVGVTRFRESRVDGHSDNECHLCLYPVTRDDTGDDEGFILGCGHVYHKACLANLRNSRILTCPACKSPIQWNISVQWNARRKSVGPQFGALALYTA
jgi:hypothetical protein